MKNSKNITGGLSNKMENEYISQENRSKKKKRKPYKAGGNRRIETIKMEQRGGK